MYCNGNGMNCQVNTIKLGHFVFGLNSKMLSCLCMLLNRCQSKKGDETDRPTVLLKCQGHGILGIQGGSSLYRSFHYHDSKHFTSSVNVGIKQGKGALANVGGFLVRTHRHTRGTYDDAELNAT